MKIVIVGGVAGGASTAARLRRMDEDAEIIMFEKGPYISFANCGLPYHISGVIADRESLLLMTPERLKEMFNINTLVNHEVISIDRQHKNITVLDEKTGKKHIETYDKLVLSPGAHPFIPPVAGKDLPGVLSLRNIPDMDEIIEYINNNNVKKAVVIGGGFIGVEIAENLQHMGIGVALVEMLPQVLGLIDPEMAALVHQHMALHKIDLALGDGLAAIEDLGDGKKAVALNSGRKIETELVIMAIGVRPENTLAKEAGIELGARGQIETNQYMQTSDPDIYALGDVSQIIHLVTGKKTGVALAGPASKQGRIVADHIVGRPSTKFVGAQGTSVVKVFDLGVASTGLSSAALTREGIEHKNVIVHEKNHAGYYPNATELVLKLSFNDEGKILGAQAIGPDGADKRIDVIATAMRAGMTVYDLEELELAYAPPFGSSRDPVNVLGYAAGNILRGDMKVIEWNQVADYSPEDVTFLDVREPIELIAGKIEGSINIPLGEVRDRLNEIPKDKPVIVYCAAGKRAYFAYRDLVQHGFDVYNLTGGYKTYGIAIEDKYIDTTKKLEVKPVVTAASTASESKEIKMDAPRIKVNATGMQCPGPILKLYNGIQEANPGDVLEVSATDSGFANDVKAWCDKTGNELLSLDIDNGTYIATVQKGGAHPIASSSAAGSGKAMVVFSGDLDKAIASFIIANGSASMGHQVTMFFTFWGLNILRKDTYVPVKKTFVEKMFGWMMPRGAKELTLSQMNMAGAGTAMIKSIMKKHHVDSVEQMIQTARENGVRLLACQMSMELMGIKKEELLDGVELAGVASFVAASDDSNATLFI